MTNRMPFLRPRVVPTEEYVHLLREIDECRLYSNYGPLNSRFESSLVRELFGGQGSALTVGNATLGLMLSIRHLARTSGRYAVMPSFTFPATPLAAKWAGLEPYFVDIDPETWAMSETEVRRALKDLGDDVAVVVPYATFGANIDLDFYADLQSSHIPVVVDAAASLGSRSGGRSFGEGFEGAVVYSMHATKAFPVGEGGIILSADHDLIEMLRRTGNFGFGPQRASELVGMNSKLSEMAAAVALATLDSFPSRVSERGRLHARYVELLKEKVSRGWGLQADDGTVAHQFMSVTVPKGVSRGNVLRGLDESGVEARTYFSPPCHVHPIFARASCGRLTVTTDVADRIVSLPLWEEMTEPEIGRVVEALES